MIYKAEWKDSNLRTHEGFVNAKNRYEAFEITQNNLNKDFIIVGIHDAKLHQITPQSLTINFPNTGDYKLFG